MATLKIELADGKQAGETLQTIRKELAAAAKEMQKATIGSQEFADSSKRYSEIKDRLKEVSTQTQATTSASEMLKKAWNGLPGAQFFNQIGDSIGMAKQGVGGLVSQFGVLKTAIAATGLGALVLVMSSLFTWFTKTDEGATKLDGIMRAIGGTVDVLLNRLMNLKETLTTLFTNPKQFFTGLVSDIKEAINTGTELANTFDELDQKRRDLELLDAQQTNRINQLLLQSKNVQLSYSERLKLLDEVDKLEQENYQAKLRYAQEYSAAVDKETEQMIKSGTITDEQLDKQNKARIDLLNVQGESISLQEKIENRRSQLEEKRDAEREKELAKQEKQNDALLKQQEKFLENQSALEQKYEATRLARIEANAKKEAETAKAAMLAAATALQGRVTEEEKAADEAKAIEEGKQAIQSESLRLFNEGTSSIIALLGADAAARKKNAETIKLFEKGRVVVNGFAEISAIAKTFAEYGPVGQVMAALRIAFSAARTAAAVKAINAQKFAVGGPVYGPSHAYGGVPIEAEGGEFIFSKKATQALGMGLLNSINRRLTFADGGAVPQNPFEASRGAAASTIMSAASGAMPGIDYEKLAAIMAGYVDNKITTLRVVNNVGDTEKGINMLNEIRNDANVYVNG